MTTINNNAWPNGSLIRASGAHYPLLSDTGVFQQGEGYERILIINGWHPGSHRRMARLHIRVDRVPAHSFANTEVWTKDAGWQTVAMIDHRDFWESMSGYLRWANDQSDIDTARLASEMVTVLVSLIEDRGVEI